MLARILVTYATRAGSTREVAEFVGETLRQIDAVVDVQPVTAVKSLFPYTHVVVGSGVRAGKLFPEAVKFAQKFRDELQQVQAAYFVVCLTMKEDTPENRQVVEAYLKPLADVKEPVSQGLFAGALNHDKLGVVWRFLLKNAKEEEDSPMVEGDWRNWEGIRDWANAFAAQAIRVS